MTTIESKYNDRIFDIRPSTPGSKQVHLELRETRPSGDSVFSFLDKRASLEIVQEIVKIVGLEPSEIFPPTVPAEQPKFAMVRLDLKTNSWAEAARRSGKSEKQAEKRHREQVRFWRNSVERDNGAQWLEAFDAEFGNGQEPKPKNAREIIDGLSVGATFTLAEETDVKARYFRKTGEKLVIEYTDDTFETEKDDWNMEHFTGLFSGWTAGSYAKAKPRVLTQTEKNEQAWAALKRGDKFHFSDHPERSLVKLSGTEFHHDTHGVMLIANHLRSRAYTIVKKEEN